MPVYRTAGKLTGVIEPENVAEAQQYLRTDHEGKPLDMAQYLSPPLAGVVELLEWHLDGNGRDWTVTAFSLRELTEAELAQLAGEVSGQNSDGLGESFEQQDFAWQRGDEDEWGDQEDGEMISFDWQTNDCAFTRVK